MVEVSGYKLEEERFREYHGNWTEFKFVFKSYSGVVARTTDLVALKSSMSRMETRTSNRSATESWRIPIECGWDKGKHKDPKEQGNKNPRNGWSSNCGKWGHNDASAWLEKVKKVNLSSEQFVVYAGGYRCRHKKELGLLVLGREKCRGELV